MLHNHSHGSRARTIGDLNPVSADTCLGSEVNAQRGDGVIGGVVIELSDEKVVVLHPQRELLHVYGQGHI